MKLHIMRAALWRAVALTIAGLVTRAERQQIIAVAEHVDQMLTIMERLG